MCASEQQKEGTERERVSIHSMDLLCRSTLRRLPLRPPGNRSHSGQPETHDVILREHGLPAVSEKVYKTQSQHHTITGVNCIYSCAAVLD